jgi:hypothetical protein
VLGSGRGSGLRQRSCAERGGSGWRCCKDSHERGELEGRETRRGSAAGQEYSAVLVPEEEGGMGGGGTCVAVDP